MTKKVFTKKEVAKLWKHQFGPWDICAYSGIPVVYHPYTCENRHDHPEVAGDKGILVPTVRGWICPFCDYTQDWAHGVNQK
jgi:hypothetical protein